MIDNYENTLSLNIQNAIRDLRSPCYLQLSSGHVIVIVKVVVICISIAIA